MTDSFDADAEQAKLSQDTSASATQKKQEKNSNEVPSQRTKAREAFFQNFAKEARSSVDQVGSKMVLIITGGLRSRSGMYDAIIDGKVDCVGIGRPACVYPDLPLTILNQDIPDDDPRSTPPPYKIKGSGVISWIPLQLAAPGWGT